MRRHVARKIVKVIVFGALALALLGALVMALWNWLVPAITGWHALTWPQAVGLLVLSRLLVGGWHGGGRHRFRERMASLPPEERERFRAAFLRHRCGPGADRRPAEPQP
jgi:hypothetical protein